MRILLDECVPRRLGNHLAGHVVSTVPKMGWSGIKNGQLLALAVSSNYDVFLTVDQNLRHQQVVSALPLAVVIVRARSNDIDQLVPTCVRHFESHRKCEEGRSHARAALMPLARSASRPLAALENHLSRTKCSRFTITIV